MNRDTQTVTFSRIAGNLRFLFAAIYLLCYFMGALFLILKLVGFEVSNDMLLIAVGIMLRFVDSVCFAGGDSFFPSQDRKDRIYTEPAQNREENI